MWSECIRVVLLTLGQLSPTSAKHDEGLANQLIRSGRGGSVPTRATSCSTAAKPSITMKGRVRVCAGVGCMRGTDRLEPSPHQFLPLLLAGFVRLRLDQRSIHPSIPPTNPLLVSLPPLQPSPAASFGHVQHSNQPGPQGHVDHRDRQRYV